jgi:hypothetical protein
VSAAIVVTVYEEKVMAAVPQNIEELFSAIQRGDQAQLLAWLDMFSSPQERYAALRALAETIQGQQHQPARDLARWANNQLHQSLGLMDDEYQIGSAADRYRRDEPRTLRGGRDDIFSYC